MARRDQSGKGLESDPSGRRGGLCHQCYMNHPDKQDDQMRDGGQDLHILRLLGFLDGLHCLSGDAD